MQFFSFQVGITFGPLCKAALTDDSRVLLERYHATHIAQRMLHIANSIVCLACDKSRCMTRQEVASTVNTSFIRSRS
jgi:hypothetical protein